MGFDDLLLQRIAERATKAGVALAPATFADLARAESALGTALPRALRQLYLRVGDGGYGPGLDVPIHGYPAGKVYPLVRVVELHQSNNEVLDADPLSPWPADVVQFADLGGFSSVAVDCRGPLHPVLEYESDVDGTAPQSAWTVVAPSVEDWFADWIDRREPPPRAMWSDRLDRT